MYWHNGIRPLCKLDMLYFILLKLDLGEVLLFDRSLPTKWVLT